MPSGITAGIYEGKETSLREYLMRVGRQMGFAIMQRDSDMAEPVKPVEESSYYERRVEELNARLMELRGMSSKDADIAAEQDFTEKHEAWEKATRKVAELRRRYEAMLREVEAWQPDPLVASTKEYALKYLRESLTFDCGKTPEDDMRFHPEPIRVPGEQWLTEQIIEAEQQLARAIEYRTEERERTADRNRHIDAFLRSLPAEGVSVA